MRFGRISLTCFLLFAYALSGSAMTRTRRGPTSPRLFSKKSSKPAKTVRSSKVTSPRGIGDERAVEIQTALIKQGYLTGEATGHWDPATQAAMQKLQADNGWQTKLIPDSRAIIKLGLGPSHDTGEALVGGGTLIQ